MFQKILVPIKGTFLPDHMAATLSWILTPVTGVVVLVHVDPTPLIAQEGDRRDVLSMLKTFSSMFHSYGIRTECCVADGDVPTTLAEIAAAQGADLIALTPDTLSRRHPFTLGSVTNYLLHTVPLPVLLVPAIVPLPCATPRRRIVVSLDGSLAAEHGLPFAVTLARDCQGLLLLVRAVLRPGNHEPDDALADMHGMQATVARHIQSASLYLQRVASPITHEGVPCHLRVLVMPPADAIVKTAMTEHADLIVMGLHGHGMVERWFHGSVTEQVVRHAPCPVLMLPATQDWLRRNVALDPYHVIPQHDLTFEPFMG